MKPTITKEQAEAIEYWTNEYGSDTYKERLIKAHVDDSVRWGDMYAPLNDLDLLTLAAALVNGYEVEKTPEEKVREYFEGLHRDEYLTRSRDEAHGLECEITGVENTLNLLGIKIEGVNA
ncbi:hypothetical protein FZC71_00910 [Bacillus subtilis]|nr:hypothetical protein FZC71_00910 [Bacillus subtilis]